MTPSDLRGFAAKGGGGLPQGCREGGTGFGGRISPLDPCFPLPPPVTMARGEQSQGLDSPGWAHLTLVDAKKRKVKCNYCGKEGILDGDEPRDPEFEVLAKRPRESSSKGKQHEIVEDTEEQFEPARYSESDSRVIMDIIHRVTMDIVHRDKVTMDMIHKGTMDMIQVMVPLEVANKRQECMTGLVNLNSNFNHFQPVTVMAQYPLLMLGILILILDSNQPNNLSLQEGSKEG
ncbi:hypothetical protein Taro_032223 [Colocasia esculenta]|uniref:Uncharacterized protein n=1 Tax=Colocasia esculenta TaxID=4460 RepID=A0A843W1A9_COLES|nr:hypothetical protein [Colocasia esculenta]